ncbi:unnamed protein product [Closterium sp. NIES-65]|nr:unnamed protein product [Closterium sp. NIES-65]
MLPYLFPDLSLFTTAEDLISHLRASDARFRAALSDEFLIENHPPMYLLSTSSSPTSLTLFAQRSGLLPLLVGSAAAPGAAGVAGEVEVVVEGAVVEAAGVVEVVGVVVGVEVVAGAAGVPGAVEVVTAGVGEAGAVVAAVVGAGVEPARRGALVV